MVGTRLNRRRQRGLTLVELLVVIVILALASSLVLFNAPPSRPAVREDAERLAARLVLAFDETIASGAVMRVTIDAAGYEFETYSEGEWKAVEGPEPLRRRTFDRRTVAVASVEDAAFDNSRALGGDALAPGEEEDEEARRIPLDPLGLQAPFEVRLSSADGSWLVSVDAAGGVMVKQDE